MVVKNPPTNSRDMGSSLVQEDPTCCGASPCITTPEPACCNHTSPGTESPVPATKEALHCSEDWPQLVTIRKSLRTATKIQSGQKSINQSLKKKKEISKTPSCPLKPPSFHSNKSCSRAEGPQLITEFSRLPHS